MFASLLSESREVVERVNAGRDRNDERDFGGEDGEEDRSKDDGRAAIAALIHWVARYWRGNGGGMGNGRGHFVLLGFPGVG
jgi:hypothetical protein